MTKFYVVNEASEIWSDEGFATRAEAEQELLEQNQHDYGTEAKVIEVEER
jgi:hypothetical protein